MNFSENFLESLRQQEPTPTLHNPYGDACAASHVRRRNLELYLAQLERTRPQFLLVGEALGYRGGRLTGIPFVSEKILATGVPSLKIFGPDASFSLTHQHAKLVSEQSATILWQTLSDLEMLPLLWNALPFHPHRPNQPQSNRTPTAAELALGHPFLQRLIKHFSIENVVAIGNKAAASLQKIGLPHHKVRHPAHGGKADFVRQLTAVVDNLA